MVQGKTYKDKNGRYYMKDDCIFTNQEIKTKNGTEIVVSFEKMSKSKGNGVDPIVSILEIIKKEILSQYNSDVLRLYICSRVGMEEELRWDESSIIGMSRWLKNCDKLVQEFEKSVGSINPEDLKDIPLDNDTLKTINKVK